MNIDLAKVGTIASYLAKNTDSLYVTKLLKLFYYIDFISFAKRGASVTNDIYYKLPYGPVPTFIKNEIDLLTDNVMEIGIKSQLAEYIELKTDSSNNGRLVLSKRNEDSLEVLAEFEIAVMQSVAKKFKSTNAKTLSEQTHREKPWALTADNSAIDYELAASLNVDQILG